MSNEKATRWIKNTNVKIGSARILDRITGRFTLPNIEGLRCNIKSEPFARIPSACQKTVQTVTGNSAQASILTTRFGHRDLR